MVPVTLQLRNFMSYGTQAPELDFRSIHVACLSGGNGQGKSALLDAMTWAIWGEARKSSGSRKPDDEILRIGAQRMKVAFTFDVDGGRYRVERSYQRSATGKTSRSELEVQAFDSEAGAYIPLTGSSMRETQEIIDRIVGLDYDTFINSAFLLQGRSDEFTKKRPSERKDILSRILNLDRYQHYYVRARERARDAKQQVQQHQLDIERLTEALASEEEWKEERQALETEIDACRERLDEVREQEQSLVQQLATFGALEREKRSLDDAVASLNGRWKGLQSDFRQLAKRIEEADQLIARARRIEQRAERHAVLVKERERLDTLQDEHRRLDKKIAGLQQDLSEKQQALRTRLHRLVAEREGVEKETESTAQRLSSREDLENKLRDAREAHRQLQSMQERIEERQQVQEELEQARRLLHGRKEALQGELQAIEQRCMKDGKALPDLAQLERKIGQLAERHGEWKALVSDIETIQEKGQNARERLSGRQGQLEAKNRELQEEWEAYEAFQQAEGDECPTCGTELTQAHRQQVLKQYRTSISKLENDISRLHAEIDRGKKSVEALRSEYRALREKKNGLDGVGEALATARQQFEQAKEAHRSLQALRQQADQLRGTLEKNDYAHEERRTVNALRERLEALAIDDEALARLRERAAEKRHVEQAIQELKRLSRKKDELVEKHDALVEHITTIETELEEGEELTSLRDCIGTQQEAMQELGFEPECLQQVREELRELAEAPARLKDLEHARRNRAEWKRQQAAIQARCGEIKAERQQHLERIQAIGDQLQERGDVEQRQREKKKEQQSIEHELQHLQQRFGQLTQQLQQAERDRTRLAKTRKQLSEAKRRQRLYKHLRVAFSKHGIPSLLIEQALPEIEHRANALLERVAEGTMHVRLETLKDKKTGGTKETLEIIITDEQGVPRAYETFSGGEAFRVNFALRLALAQLLAERNGVQVHTLVIDEGFGTQDQQGIENLVEAIQSVKDDFEKILVITHLNELKEVFPVRIEVEKDPATGSTFEMIGV